jgi:sulfite exporter TauE/SafE
MSSYELLNNTTRILTFFVLGLSIIALTAELLPEVKAKIIVIPTLLLMIALCLLEVQQRRAMERS